MTLVVLIALYVCGLKLFWMLPIHEPLWLRAVFAALWPVTVWVLHES